MKRNNKNITISQDQKNTFWNMIAALVNAAESVIVVMVVSRVNTLTEAGIVTLAFSIANLFSTIGKFGMKNYQISHEGYDITFDMFLKSRWISTMLMALSLTAYFGINWLSGAYSMDKIWIMVCVCIWYGIEAFEDVYLGSFQARGRLDVGNQIFIIRWTFILGSFLIMDIVTKKLLLSLAVSCILSFIAEVVCILFVTKHFDCLECENKYGLGKLLKENFPLFIAGFALFYMTNISKYVIDIKLNDDMQAIYGYIAMPVFVIALLNNMIYQPQLMHYITELREHQIDKFVKRLVKQIGLICGILLVCLIGAYVIGIQVLSILYGLDLSAYKIHMLVCLVGGAFLAVGGFLVTILTIMGKQKIIMYVYLSVIAAGTVITYLMVDLFALDGAVAGYLATMIIMGISFVAVTFYQIQRLRKVEQTCS